MDLYLRILAFCPHDVLGEEIHDSPLVQRAWVTQERLLSKRVLHFADVLIWECPSIVASEIQPLGLTNSAGVVSNGLKAGRQKVLEAHEGEAEHWRAGQEMRLVKHPTAIDNITSSKQLMDQGVLERCC